MNQLAFVTAAYLVVLGGTGGLLAWSAASMRRAERLARELGERR